MAGQQECQATPLPDTDHDGPVGAYVRICPAGHFRFGYACTGCAGDGAVMCIGCGSEAPAILISAAIWQLITEPAQLTAEGAGPLLDDACRAGHCSGCVGPPCEHGCYEPAFPLADAKTIAAEVAADVQHLGAEANRGRP